MTRILTYFTIIAIGVLSLANSLGRAAGARAGNTGAPGDQFNGPNPITCQFCHNSAAIQVALQVQVFDQSQRPVTEYIPNQVYTVRVSVNTLAGSPTGFGFQCIPIFDRTNTDTKGLRNPAPNVKLIGLTTNGRLYAEHNGVSDSPQFVFEWQAPPAGSGWVTFYAAGNGVNRNGASSGDGSASTSFSINEAIINSTTNQQDNPLRIYPNPCSDFFTVDGIATEHIRIILFDLQGNIAARFQGAPEQSFDISGIASGIYTYMIFDKQDHLIHTGRLAIQGGIR